MVGPLFDFSKFTAAFARIAPQLKHGIVAIVFLCLFYGLYGAELENHVTVLGLIIFAIIVIAVLMLPPFQKSAIDALEAARKIGEDRIITIARDLWDSRDDIAGNRPKNRDRLFRFIRRLYYAVNRPDLADEIEQRRDELLPPPP